MWLLRRSCYTTSLGYDVPPCRPVSCRRLAESTDDSTVDLRSHRLFQTNGDADDGLDCCPTVTQRNRRTVAINRQGLVIELFQTRNITQEFYETMCRNDSLSATNHRSCRFVDSRLAASSRCVQQWSYVYAIGRLFGRLRTQFNLDYVRIPTGCKCQVSTNAVTAIQDDDQR